MTNLASISKTTLTSLPIPLPPLAEQHRLVAKLGQRIGESRRLAGQQLQTALREALAGPDGAAVTEEAVAAGRRVGKRVAGVGGLFADME